VAKNSISILDTAKIGILPFIVPDIIKVLAAAAISKKIIARQK
jgi:biotin transporter BioY